MAFSPPRSPRPRAVVSAALASLLALSTPVTALAQSAQDRASARVMADDADKKVAAGDLAGAIDSFTKAYAFVPAPTIKVARAHAHLKLGHLIVDAARSDAQPGEPPSWGEARHKALAEADAITPRLPLLVLGVTGAPADRVNFTVDGALVPPATLGAPRAVNPGTHTVKAEASGFLPAEESVTVAEGEHKTVTLTLTASAPAPIPMAVPAPMPVAPAPQYAPPPTYYAPPPQTAAPAPMAQPFAAPPPVEKPNNTLSTTGWILTAVFGGTGAVTGLIAITQASAVKNQCTNNVCPTSVKSQADTSSTFGTISTVTFCAAGGTLLLALLTHKSAPSRAAKAASPMSVDLQLGLGSVGAAGTF
jgi:hypothetical protein